MSRTPMCGIAGIYHFDPGNPVAGEALEAMRAALAHRGPDDRGTHLDGSVGLCHTRLSIIDLSSRARQPMLSPDGRYALSYNGELYNFRELRAELEREGCEFRTSGDSEVILQLMIQRGAAGVERLEGMFAFAFYDREKRSLLLVRDRLGIKPLFWSRTGDGVAFASEPKALPPASRRESPDPARIAEYLAFRHLAGEESLQPDVNTLAPGHLLALEGDTLECRRWWRPTAGAEADPDAVMGVITGAVERQLVSDVPVGIFLSGGVDSSLVTSAAAHAHESIDSFTVGFNEAGWDETDRAQVVADATGTRQHIVRLEPESYAKDLGRAIWHLDAPLNHAHSVHLLELSRFARKVVTVVLTGEGGDELYGGYPRYRIFLASRLLKSLPSSALRGVANALRRSRPRLARLLDAAAVDAARAAALNSAFLPIGQAAQLAGLADPEDAIENRQRLAAEAISAGGHPADGLLALERQTYLVSLLQRMDRMSMAEGLECRVPLLDERVLEHSLAIPATSKLGLGDSKIPLRRAAEKRYGKAYAYAPKFGFGVPLDAWFRGEGAMGRAITRVFDDSRMRERGWIDANLASQYLVEHRSGVRDHTEALWGLLNLELWARIGLEGEATSEFLEQGGSAPC